MSAAAGRRRRVGQGHKAGNNDGKADIVVRASGKRTTRIVKGIDPALLLTEFFAFGPNYSYSTFVG